MKNTLNVESQKGKLNILSREAAKHLKGGTAPSDPNVVDPLQNSDGVIIEDLNQI